MLRRCLVLFTVAVSLLAMFGQATAAEQRYLYAAVPGVRDLLEYGGHGILVFDIDNGHKFVRRIPASGKDKNGKPLNVKGICANATTGRLYVSTIVSLQCFDLATDKLLWEQKPAGGCDRMSLTPNGKTLFVPSFEGPHWNIINAATGETITKITPNSGAHNTIVGPNGKFAYLAGLKSNTLTIVDTKSHGVVGTCGPFTKEIRPFTVNAAGTRVYVNVNDLLGFEVGDLTTGTMLFRVPVEDFKKGAVKRHGCPSHGIGLTVDEKELWVTDAHNKQMHIFDNTVEPPKIAAHVTLRDEPGWISFGLDGKFAYPSTGDVVDIATRKIVTTLSDEEGRAVQCEKMLEIDFADGQPVRAGDQFGFGRSRK